MSGVVLRLSRLIGLGIVVGKLNSSIDYSRTDFMSQQHDIEDLARIFMEHYPLVIGIIRRYSVDPDALHDFVHQVFIQFVQGYLKFHWDLSRDIKPLLGELTRNTVVSSWRKERNFSQAMTNLRERMLAEASAGSVERIEEKTRMRIDALKECLETLPPHSRRLIEDHYFHGMSMSEIARAQEAKDTRIRQALCRIRHKLRECIERKQRDPE